MRVLILKDVEQNALLECKVLSETSNIFYEIVSNAPEIEEREGYNGYYTLDESGELIVEYQEIEPTEVEKLESRLAQMQEEVAMLAEYTMLAMDTENESV